MIVHFRATKVGDLNIVGRTLCGETYGASVGTDAEVLSDDWRKAQLEVSCPSCRLLLDQMVIRAGREL